MIEFPRVKERRTAPTYARRWQLAREASSPRAAPPFFLKSLRRYDPDLEPHWHRRMERWVLYRVFRRGVVPAQDHLVKEYEVMGPRGEYRPLGLWVLDWLRAHDKTEGGSVDPQQANRNWIRSFEESEARFERQKEREYQDVVDQCEKDLVRDLVKGRQVFA
jgi:hypothetical protein